MSSLLDERRLVSRVLRHWTDMAAGQRLPSKHDIDPWLVGDDWAHCVLIRLDPAQRRWTFVVVGEQLLPSPKRLLDGRPIADCPSDTLLGVSLSYLARVVAARVPLTIGGTAFHLDAPILYRSVLMPLSDDGQEIDAVLGAANFRKAHDGQNLERRIQLDWSPAG